MAYGFISGSLPISYFVPTNSMSPTADSDTARAHEPADRSPLSRLPAELRMEVYKFIATGELLFLNFCNVPEYPHIQSYCREISPKNARLVCQEFAQEYGTLFQKHMVPVIVFPYVRRKQMYTLDFLKSSLTQDFFQTVDNVDTLRMVFGTPNELTELQYPEQRNSRTLVKALVKFYIQNRLMDAILYFYLLPTLNGFPQSVISSDYNAGPVHEAPITRQQIYRFVHNLDLVFVLQEQSMFDLLQKFGDDDLLYEILLHYRVRGAGEDRDRFKNENLAVLDPVVFEGLQKVTYCFHYGGNEVSCCLATKHKTEEGGRSWMVIAKDE